MNWLEVRITARSILWFIQKIVFFIRIVTLTIIKSMKYLLDLALDKLTPDRNYQRAYMCLKVVYI